jgi:hypothetical protein
LLKTSLKLAQILAFKRGNSYLVGSRDRLFLHDVNREIRTKINQTMHVRVGNLNDLKFNLETWRRELRFHFDEMDTFQDKLEEIVGKDLGQGADKSLENFQNRIMLEKAAISKLKHRCKSQMRNESLDESLGLDMRTYIKMHYDLKEEMMDFFSENLGE